MKEKLYQGSSKAIYNSNNEYTFLMYFSDMVRSGNGRILELAGKGVLNNNISTFIMTHLDLIGIENHLIEKINMREQLIQCVDVFPVTITVTSVACGRYVTDIGMEEGYVFDQPIIDYKLRSAKLNYPIINEYQTLQFGFVTTKEMTEIKIKALRIYDFLSGLFLCAGIRLVECNLEFGRVFNGDQFITMLADEISPDNCRLWNMYDNEKMGYELIDIDPNLAIKSYHMIEEMLKIRNNN
jgi:phosphoribosylaminoimidazole-succinocarboxamide synthase